MVEQALDASARDRLKLLLATQMNVSGLERLTPPRIDSLTLPTPRVSAPDSLNEIVSITPLDRASHTYGKAYRDLVRARRGDLACAPDLVAFPRDEHELSAILDWCSNDRVAAIPYGGGTSVVGGVEARLEGRYEGAVSIDLTRIAGVREVDRTSRAALIDAGTLGPDLEEALRPHGLTLRHYPQSFEYSTLGGWIATRAGGHFATLYTHIDDMVESLTVVTPAGLIETRRLPASGAGPSPERLFLGSEGALGIIVRAWMRLMERPRFRASASFRFGDFYAAAGAARLLAQSGLFPSNCRVLDEREALVNSLGDGSSSLLLIAFESADHPLDAWLNRALEIARGAGGEEIASRPSVPAADDTSEKWKDMFLRGPYLRDALVELGIIVETFETAIGWDRFEDFHREVHRAAAEAVTRICGEGIITSRITHVYPDGAAPYFTVIAPGRSQSHVAQWDEIKAAVSETIHSAGGTITHHHAVGRDHRAWYDHERPELFGKALASAKRALDPAGILNPGVLTG